MDDKMNDKVIEAAAKAPMLFVNASLGEGEDYDRETGIQLTKEQIISLRKYETLGLSLPIQLNDVIAYLNYGSGDNGGVGRTAEDFLRTFKMTYQHARRWSPLREKVMLTGNDLKIFAGSIIRTGTAIVEVYEELKASKYLEEHDISTVEEYLKLQQQMPGLPDLDLSPGDIADIRSYLNDLLTKIRLCHQKAEQVRGELDSFGIDMRATVLPEIKLRLEFVSRNTYAADIKDLQGQMDQRSAEIDELNKQYEKLVQDAIKAAAGLNIGGLVMAIYQGVKAEKIRHERNALKQLQQADNQKMASKNQTLSSLNKVRDDLQNLSYVAIEAEVATQNLMLVWNALSDYVGASIVEVDKIDEAASLRRFKNQIMDIIEPWQQIKSSADQLLAVFAEADKEYEKNNVSMRSGAVMHSLSINAVEPAFNMSNLRGHNASVQRLNTTAQMLFEQFDYMPGTVGAMNGVALAVNKATFELRDNAQKLSISMVQSEKKLKSYQAELSSPEDAEEVREDMEAELKDLCAKVTAQTKDFKSIHKSIGAAYDRMASAEWIVKLEDERASTEELKTQSEEKVAAFTAEMKSISDAIDLIAKAGIEKIGQEAQLSLDNLKALGLAPPQVQVALLAIDTLKKLISGIGEAISYLNMLAAYRRLSEKAVEMRAQVQKLVNAITRIVGRIELVTTLDELDDERSKYGTEFASLINYFDLLSSEFTQDTSVPVEDRADAAIARITEAVTVLKTISQ
ncbi:alpha-xenorhabdolysin family binary toxin subunit A [Pseudomonas syringae]|nr:alpha-xenorhabdolysin family binary toxin subunit A [Pseudomonas syringae]MCF5068838.1 alpha-xenorhabdolysin family binary toxin subunit A [Pseudomonas syringae]